MQYTSEETNNRLTSPHSKNLIITNHPIEEFNDFMSDQLSDGHFTLEIFKQQRNIQNTNFEINENQQAKAHEINRNPQNTFLNTNPLSPTDQTCQQQSRKKFLRKGSITFNQPQNQEIEELPKSPESKKSRKSFNKQNSLMIGTSFIQLFHLKRFIGRLLKRRNNFSSIEQYHFDLLNDKGAEFTPQIFKQKVFTFRLRRIKMIKKELIWEKIWKVIKNFANKMIAKLEYWDSQIPLVYPETKKKVMWDSVLAFFRLYFMFLIPLELAFPEQFLYYGQVYYFTLLATLILSADLLLAFNTAYYQFGQVVTKRSQIALHVMGKVWGLEVLSIFYLFSMLFIDKHQIGNEGDYIQLGFYLFIFQIRYVTRLITQFEEVMNLSKPQSSMLELAKLIMAVFYMLHVFSCSWFWCGYYSQSLWGQSWLNYTGTLNAVWQKQYLTSLYYSTVTMFTVGYGDITPQNDLEMFMSIIFMMICSIQLSYSVNTVGAIIDKISMYNEIKMKKLRVINAYMQKKKIGYQLQYQIREYLNYYWQSLEDAENEEENIIINQLSENLREELMIEANSIILNKSPLFNQLFSSDLKKRLVKIITQQSIQPENIIDFDRINSGTSVDSGIFLGFIEEGSIEILVGDDQKQKLLNTLNDGDNFGLISFMTGFQAKEKYRSVGFTKLLLISREDFLKVMKEFPEDLERFNQLKDDLLLNNSEKSNQFLSLRCFSCKTLGHLVGECPILHYIPSRELVIKRHIYSQEQSRNQRIMNRGKQKNMFFALHDRQICEDVASFIQNAYWNEASAYDMETVDQLNKSRNSSEDEREIKRNIIGNPIIRSRKILRRKTITEQDPSSALLRSQFSSSMIQERKSVRLKLQKVVGAIKIMNRFKSLTKNKVYSKRNNERFCANQLEYLRNMKEKGKMGKEQEEIYLKLMTMLNGQIESGMDQYKEYKYYMNEFNLENVLEDLDKKQGFIKSEKFKELFSKWIKYLMYPKEFLNKYKKKGDDIRENERQMRMSQLKNIAQKKTFSQQMRTYQEVLKMRNKARQIIMNRSNKVQPSKDDI